MKTPLDTYDKKPQSMVNYLRYYGLHFNKRLCDFAVSKMKHGKSPISKEKAEEILNRHGVKLDNNELFDHVYVINMGNNDFFGSSIEDEKHLARYVKDVIDDEDGYDGIVFNRWYADMCRKGVPVEWEEML